MTVRMIERAERNRELDRLLIREGTALDVGTGGTMSMLFPSRKFSKVVGISPYRPLIDVMRARHLDRPEWSFECIDVRDYILVEQFDLITMLHVVEHLSLPDLSAVLDRLVPACRKQFVIETPDQFDSNESAIQEDGDPYERHVSLVTGDFLAPWGFHPLVRYWQNERFSNTIYLRGDGE